MIIKLNFETEQTDIFYKFTSLPLKRQPEFFLMNKEQNIMITASPEDGIYVDLRDPKNVIEVDLDEKYEIG